MPDTWERIKAALRNMKRPVYPSDIRDATLQGTTAPTFTSPLQQMMNRDRPLYPHELPPNNLGQTHIPFETAPAGEVPMYTRNAQVPTSTSIFARPQYPSDTRNVGPVNPSRALPSPNFSNFGQRPQYPSEMRDTGPVNPSRSLPIPNFNNFGQRPQYPSETRNVGPVNPSRALPIPTLGQRPQYPSEMRDVGPVNPSRGIPVPNLPSRPQYPSETRDVGGQQTPPNTFTPFVDRLSPLIKKMLEYDRPLYPSEQRDLETRQKAMGEGARGFRPGEIPSRAEAAAKSKPKTEGTKPRTAEADRKAFMDMFNASAEEQQKYLAGLPQNVAPIQTIRGGKVSYFSPTTNKEYDTELEAAFGVNQQAEVAKEALASERQFQLQKEAIKNAPQVKDIVPVETFDAEGLPSVKQTIVFDNGDSKVLQTPQDNYNAVFEMMKAKQEKAAAQLMLNMPQQERINIIKSLEPDLADALISEMRQRAKKYTERVK